ncbi:MAG: spore photoproduct lyase family protein [Vulcanimicrobiota bacterium]
MKEDGLLPPFSHLYVEEDLLESTWSGKVTQLCNRFGKAVVVPVRSFQEVTQRRTARWNDQKRSPKLVIARKRGELIYPCSEVAPNFGHPHFYYAVPMQNCLYDCEYCYLQGMYTSPNLVYFVNQEEMIKRAVELARELGELYLCIAYDNDLLAMEGALGVTAEWVEGLRNHPSVTVEVRTKSANFAALKKLAPPTNFILAWTLSPEPVIRQFEAGTPGLEARLKSLKAALSAGWRARLCLDPLLPVKDWPTVYEELFRRLDQEELWQALEDASYGPFRMPKQLLRQARKARPDSALLHSAQSREERGLMTFGGTDQERLLEYVGTELRKRMPTDKVWT